MFIFYLPRGGEADRVERYTKDDGVERVMELSDDGKQGYMILDVKRDEKLTTDLPARLWGSIMLSSPNKRNYKAWHETNTGTRLLYISRYHAREMKPCFAWLRRADLAAGEGNAAVRTELEKSCVSWKSACVRLAMHRGMFFMNGAIDHVRMKLSGHLTS
ncbi:putative retrotransposon hot spot protein 4 (RHS4) [Trypanosoma vivax]|nr:putative retrotransposon hot spot protein 4 (RHS4) [Trypanosoma vivax]